MGRVRNEINSIKARGGMKIPGRLRDEEHQKSDAVLDESRDDHDRHDETGKREGHRDLARHREGARQEAEEIREQHEDEDREHEGEKDHAVFAGGGADHVGDEFVGELGHRLHAARHQLRARDGEHEEQRCRANHDAHPERLVGENEIVLWKWCSAFPCRNGRIVNCSIGLCMESGLLIVILRGCRASARRSRVKFCRRPHHIADARGCSQHKHHYEEDRPRAQEPVKQPPQSSADDDRDYEFGRETSGDSKRRRRRLLSARLVLPSDFVNPLAQCTQVIRIGHGSPFSHPNARIRAFAARRKRADHRGDIFYLSSSVNG